MTNLVKPLYQYNRFDELKQFILDFYETHKDEILQGYQYPLQGMHELDGINTCMHEKFGGNFTGDENVFDVLLAPFKGTEVEMAINEITAQGYSVCRSRLFLMPAGHEMSIHTDPTPRIHIPIITDVGNEFWFWKNTPAWTKIKDADASNIIHREHLPANGNVYWVNTQEFHAFVNHSSNPRLHLVFGLKK